MLSFIFTDVIFYKKKKLSRELATINTFLQVNTNHTEIWFTASNNPCFLYQRRFRYRKEKYRYSLCCKRFHISLD